MAATGTAPRPFVFVLMPFAQSYDDVYELAIRAACDAAGAYAERVDKQIFDGSILERLYNQIAKADLLVADLSERNANVFYEVGYAHALGKTTILVTRDAADIPFDLQHYPHVVYGNSLAALRDELTRRVAWHLQHPAEAATSAPDVRVIVNEVPLPSAPPVKVRFRGTDRSFRLHLAVQNAARERIRVLDFQAALVTPDSVGAVRDDAAFSFPCARAGDERVYAFPEPVRLLPEQWRVLNCIAVSAPDVLHSGSQLACSLRLYFESGPVELPFSLEVA